LSYGLADRPVLWLYDDHAHVTAFHGRCADRLTAEQRLTILRIKDVWHRRPEYPDEVSGFEIYTAVAGSWRPNAVGVREWLSR
jgi:hypothetical protein